MYEQNYILETTTDHKNLFEATVWTVHMGTSLRKFTRLGMYATTHNGFVSFPQNKRLTHWIYVATLIQTGLETRTTKQTQAVGCVHYLVHHFPTPVEHTIYSDSFQCRSRTHGFVFRHGRVTTPTTTDRRTTDWHVYYNLQLQQQTTKSA